MDANILHRTIVSIRLFFEYLRANQGESLKNNLNDKQKFLCIVLKQILFRIELIIKLCVLE